MYDFFSFIIKNHGFSFSFRKIKEKDYEYQEKNRKLKLAQAPNDPLKNPKKEQDSTLKGLKSEIGKPGLFVDPLNAKKLNPLANPLAKANPLGGPKKQIDKAANFAAAKSEFNENVSSEEKNNFQIIKNAGDSNSAVKDRVVEFKNAEKKKEIGLWSGIRSDFVKIFDLRNMEHFINNVIKFKFFFLLYINFIAFRKHCHA